MEDSFRVRIDKAFGSLGMPPSVGVTSSLWCLTDEEIERRKWNRNKDETEEGHDGVESRPCSLRNQLEEDLQDFSNHGEEEEDEENDDEKKKQRWNNSSGVGESSADEFLNVQSNIGRDCTLDYEEEEDEYDKVAVGKEQTGNCIYMKDVKYATYGIDDNEYDELPTTFCNVVRDPRANHEAAKIRLKEDAEAAGNFDTLQLSDSPVATNVENADRKRRELDGDNPKPILKKRENLMDSRSQKRVRFTFSPKSSTQTHQEKQSSITSDLTTEPHAGDDSSVPEQASDLSQYSSGIPDYVRNPSKYTRYTFDSSDDMDDQSNQKACMDFFSNLRKSNTDSLPVDASIEIPKSIVFTPKKKPEDDIVAKRIESEQNTRGDNVKNKSWSIGITAEDYVQESEISPMEEDEPSLERSRQKPGRQYRTRTNINVEDD